MPTFLSVMKDTCPIVNFEGSWKGGSALTDKLLDSYSSGTYHYSQTEGDTMTLKFNGTGVGIYGAKRPGHGDYQITVDGQTYPILNANSTTPLFNQTLFNATFDAGFHTVTIKNAGNTTLDVDYVALQAWAGEPDEHIFVDTFQDDHSSYTYDPPEAWTEVSQPSAFSGSSGHFSNQWNSSFVHKFKGASVFLYGTVSPAGSPAYTAQLDGGEVLTLSAQTTTARPHQLLYYASGLGAGWHEVRLQVGATPDVVGSLSVDFSNIYTTSSVGSALLLDNGPVEPIPRLSRGAIAGLSVTSALALIALISLISLIFRQKREKKQWSRTIPKTMSEYSISA